MQSWRELTKEEEKFWVEITYYLATRGYGFLGHDTGTVKVLDRSWRQDYIDGKWDRPFLGVKEALDLWEFYVKNKVQTNWYQHPKDPVVLHDYRKIEIPSSVDIPDFEDLPRVYMRWELTQNRNPGAESGVVTRLYGDYNIPVFDRNKSYKYFRHSSDFTCKKGHLYGFTPFEYVETRLHRPILDRWDSDSGVREVEFTHVGGYSRSHKSIIFLRNGVPQLEETPLYDDQKPLITKDIVEVALRTGKIVYITTDYGIPDHAEAYEDDIHLERILSKWKHQFKLKD